MNFDFMPLWISLKTATAATVITFFVGILAARWRLSRGGPMTYLVDGVLMLPLALPPTVVGLGLLLAFGRYSPIGQLLAHYGTTLVFTWPATVLASTVVALPIMYLSARGAFAQIDASLLDAARIFGFSEWRILWWIMLPLAWPGIAAGTVLTFLRALGEFGATLMIAGNIPAQTQTTPVAIFFAVEAGERAQPIAWALIILAIAITILCVINTLSRRLLA